MSMIRDKAEKAFKILRTLPRIQINNVRDNPKCVKRSHRGRGQHGGDKHGGGDSGQRMNFMRLGYETGNTPFYLRFQCENYYKGHHLRRQYPPISLLQLQALLDTDRIDHKQPIDITTFCNTGLFDLRPDQTQYGFQLTDEGINNFKSKICIEVQHASELVIAAIESNGGIIRTAYYDPRCLQILANPKKWFEKSIPIPLRLLPPQDLISKYTSAESRGYLANPEEISQERFVLAQKYGYELPRIEDDPDYEWMKKWKDPRQLFLGLEPGWVINLPDKCIIKRKE